MIPWKKYTTALVQKRVYRFFGLHSVIMSVRSGWKVKIVGFVPKRNNRRKAA